MKLLSILSLISLFTLSCQSKPSVQKITKIEGKSHEGKEILIETSKKKATIVIFLSSVCPCSNSNIQMLKKEVAKYPEYQFVGIHSNFNEDPIQAKKYFKEKGLNFPIIKDYDSRLVNVFDAVKTPHVFILDSNGNTLYKGGTSNASQLDNATENYLEESLIAIKESKPLPTPKRKTLGCYIPRTRDA